MSMTGLGRARIRRVLKRNELYRHKSLITSLHDKVELTKRAAKFRRHVDLYCSGQGLDNRVGAKDFRR